MNKDHRLDAPDNESLRNIEQLGDHSELSTHYFTARKEWDGKEILSDEQREEKNNKALLTSTLAIRRQFAVIGLLIPTPLVLLVILISLAATYLTLSKLSTLLTLVIILVGIWALISFLAIRRVYRLFYAHALKATPFIIVLVALLGLSTQESYLLTRGFHTQSFTVNTIIVAAGTYLASIALSALLLSIWTSPRISAGAKLAYAALTAFAILTLISVTIML